MEKIEKLIGRLMTIGVVIAVFFVLLGGILYLWAEGKTIIHYSTFHGENHVPVSTWRFLLDALNFSPRGFIQLGLLTLIFMQLLRAALTAWYFHKLRDQIFTWISLFILGVLIYSLFFAVN